MLLSTLLGLLVRLGWLCGWHDGSGVLGLPRCGAGVVDGALVVRAYGDGGPYPLAEDDDGGLGCFAAWYRLGIRVVNYRLNLFVDAPLHGSGSLLLGVAVPILNLDEFGLGRDLAVDVGVDLRLEARRVEALIALHVDEEGRVVSAAPGCRCCKLRQRG